MDTLLAAPMSRYPAFLSAESPTAAVRTTLTLPVYSKLDWNAKKEESCVIEGLSCIGNFSFGGVGKTRGIWGDVLEGLVMIVFGMCRERLG